MSPLEIIGVLSVVYFGCKLVFQATKCLYYYCIKSPMKKDILMKQRGRWAVITGATDGIGKSYANALGAMGMNVVLISRDIKKLNDCAGDIEAKHNVQTKVIPVDFTKGIEIYEEIERVLSGLEIGVLVNNVGISYSYPEVFLSVPDKRKFFSAIIRANVVSVTKMCEIAMPGMVDRKSGVVINISSASALIPAPMLTVYAATKCYVEKFSDELRNEYENEGLVIQTVLPGYVATKMSKIRKSTWMAPTADKFVQSALSKVGVFDHTTGYFPHTLFVSITVGKHEKQWEIEKTKPSSALTLHIIIGKCNKHSSWIVPAFLSVSHFAIHEKCPSEGVSKYAKKSHGGIEYANYVWRIFKCRADVSKSEVLTWPARNITPK